MTFIKTAQTPATAKIKSSYGSGSGFHKVFVSGSKKCWALPEVDSGTPYSWLPLPSPIHQRRARAGQAAIAVFQVFVMTRPGIEASLYHLLVARAQPVVPSDILRLTMLLKMVLTALCCFYFVFQKLGILRHRCVSCWWSFVAVLLVIIWVSVVALPY